MFRNMETNMRIIEGAYRKFKTYYYYNKNFIIIRQKIAVFESNHDDMYNTFINLSNLLKSPQSNNSKDLIQKLIDKVNFCVFPKKFESDQSIKDKVISNVMLKDKKLRTVNFFADLPIELYILDTIWTIILGKMSFDKKLLSYDVYGNTLIDKLLYQGDSMDDIRSIDFDSNRMFNIYFYKYSQWRNNAFKELDHNYNNKKDSVLISLDIKGYYYSVKFKFDIKEIFDNHPLVKKIEGLTNIMKKLYFTYFELVKPYRSDFNKFNKNETPLPIGLFSSMLIGNLYLGDFDKHVRSVTNCRYYGRYVDDLLFCFTTSNAEAKGNTEFIQELMIESKILNKYEDDFSLFDFSNLLIQKDKIKVIYISAMESRAIIDLYNDTIRIIPSQMNIIPDYDLKLTDFDETAYSIENFGRDKKIRDMGAVNIDGFKVARYFTTLVLKQTNIQSFDKFASTEIYMQIQKINEFFMGSRGVEYYNNWMNYMYFLVLSRNYSELKTFYSSMKKLIAEMNGTSLNRDTYCKKSSLGKRTRETLYRHLDICISSALAIDIEVAKLKKYSLTSFYDLSNDLLKSNMFNHSLVSIPLANYLEYAFDISYSRMNIERIGKVEKDFESSFKVKWSPRFINFQELLLLLFMHRHNNNIPMNAKTFSNEEIVEKFYKINNISNQNHFQIQFSQIENFDGYVLQEITIPETKKYSASKDVTIAVGNIKLDSKDCISVIKNRWHGLTIKNKQILRNILKETYSECDSRADLLVLPELYVPIYWLQEVIDFSKKSQIAIVTGLQYIPDGGNKVCNYIATIFPFQIGKYKNVFVFIREKNDYSPIEKIGLAEIGKKCSDATEARYQIFHWKELDIATFVCYEFTDIFARALLKGKCDIIAAPVFNSDTTYFSNIIDCTARDLHTIIVQANTSVYGDSRITGPYDRDSKDIFKIKGGDNDHVIIGTVKLDDIINYQADYYDNLDMRLKLLLSRKKGIKEKINNSKKIRPEIKKISARYDIKRAKAKRNPESL